MIFALMLTVVVSSCTKNDPVAPGDTTDQTQSYYPLKVGYWWDYTSTVKGYPPTYRTTIGPEEVKNGKTYMTSTSTNSTVKGYFRVENNKVYSLGPNPYFGVNDESEYLSMDYNKAIGDSLEFNSINASSGIPQKYTIIMKEKKSSFTTPTGVTYSDVLVVRVNLYINYPSVGLMLMTYSDSYYAKGIGHVYTETPGLGNLELTDYSFKK